VCRRLDGTMGECKRRDYIFYGKGKENNQLCTGFLYTTEQYQQIKERSLLVVISHNIVLRGGWCNIIVLNVHAPGDEKSDV
jgi:hypothetical protein